MSETTYEEACRCPKCNKPGELQRKNKAESSNGDQVEVHVIMCKTDLCPWSDTTWLVQVNKDGSVPQAYSQLGDKRYPKLSQETESRIQDNIRRQLEAETGPGAEIVNPNDPRR